MASPIRSWIALGVLAFVGNAAVRPAVPPAADDAAEPTVTPAAGPGTQGAAPPPATQYAPPPPYGYPPPGYAPPGYAPYPAYRYQQPQLTKVHRPRRGLVTAGAITFGVTWGIAATVSVLLNCSGIDCSDVKDYLWVPVAGPALVAARSDGGGDAFLIFWSAGQAAGAVMLVFGLIGHDVMEYRMARGGPTLRLTPLLARETSGMALTARW